MTDPGTVMGTVGYMAPEQVRGQAVDARADVFAFGAVLYEMVSGKRTFHRDTAADSMTAILTEDPPELVASRPDLSPALDRIIRHCLEKNANERFQNARDVAFALEALSGSQVSRGVAAVAPPAGRWRRTAMIAALVVAAFVAGGLLTRQLTPAPTPITFETKTLTSQWITRARFASGRTNDHLQRRRVGQRAGAVHAASRRHGSATARPAGRTPAVGVVERRARGADRRSLPASLPV